MSKKKVISAGVAGRISPWRVRYGWGGLALGVFLMGLGVGWLMWHGRNAAEARGLETERSVGGGTWVIATYNVHNFFDAYVNPYRGEVGKVPKTGKEQEVLAAAIREMNADVLVMEEVEWGGVLERFVKERLGGAGYRYVVDEPTGDARGISVGVISRFPVRRIVSHRLTELEGGGGEEEGAGKHFARDLLRVDVEVKPGYVVAVYGVHLKSRLDAAGDAKSAKWRLAEARRARALVREEMGREGVGRFVVLGDCNDGPGSEAVGALRGDKEEAGERLVDCLGRLGAEERVSFVNAQYHEAIDNIFLSPELGKRMVGEGGVVLRGGVFEKASDHRPVRVVLGLP